MSLILSVYVGEGIVLASDSRITYNATSVSGGSTIHNFGVHHSDTTNKTFLCPNAIGISACGDASIDGKPIAGIIEAFIRESMDEKTDIDETPDMLIRYFNRFSKVPDAVFLVAGYRLVDGRYEQRLWKVMVRARVKERMETAAQGATWAGEVDVLSSIIQNFWMKQPDGQYIEVSKPDIPFNYFTLQDAVDFVQYAIRTTIDTMKFQSRVKSVGGPIDILVLKPEEAFWVSKKTLHT